MSKPNKRHAERRAKKIGSSKVFSAKKSLARATKKQSNNVKRGHKGQTPKPRKDYQNNFK